MSATLLVTGASGQMGRRVVELLLESHDGPIIAATRSPQNLADLAVRGVEVRYANFDEPASLATAFAGVDRLLLISTDALGEPNKRLNQHVAAVTAAEQAGVKHVVYTSLVNADDTPVIFAPDHAGTEQALAASSLGWTVLRNNLYMDLLIQTVSQGYQMGSIYSAAGDGKTAYITREDCARAAAAALAAPFDGTRILNITGPQALSAAEIAGIASGLTGKSLSYTFVPLEAVIQGMVGVGLPQPLAETFASIDTAIAAGKMAAVSPAFEELTGHAPTSALDFLKAHEAALTEAITAQ